MSPPANLVFVVERPNLADLPSPDESVVVPLRWEILTLSELKNYKVINPARWLSGDLACQMQEKLDCEWLAFLGNQTFDTASDYSYCFYTTLCPILYWEHIIASALQEFRPQLVWLPVTTQSPSVQLSQDFFCDRAKFLTWARYATLDRASRNSHVKYFLEEPIYGTSRSLRKGHIFFALSLRQKAEVLLARTRKYIDHTLKSWSRSKAAQPPLLIVSQPPKSAVLLELLDKAQIPYEFNSYAQFEARLEITADQNVSCALGGHAQSPAQELSRWLSQIIRYSFYETRQKMESVADCYSVLIHDAAHHPQIRALNRSFIKLNKEVVYIPEGAQYPSDQSWPYVQNLFGHAVGQTRFVLSEGEIDFYQKQKVAHHQWVITGYFGKTGPRVRGTQWRKSEVQTKYRRRLKVFLDQLVFSDSGGIGRPSSSYFEWFPELLRLINALRAENFEVFSNSRDLLAAQTLESASGGGLRVRYGLRWYEIAESCDVVISVDSSIILESIAIFKPVIVYHPPWYREYQNIYSAKYEVITSGVMRFASTPEGAVAAIRELVDSPKEDFHRYKYFLAEEQWRAVDWIKAALNSPDCV